MSEKRYKEETKLEETFGRKGGWKVPDGYFQEVADMIMKEKPAWPEAPKVPDMTVWQRLKPYVYLAAMFAGIWMMMQVFARVSGVAEVSLDNPPEQIAMIVNSGEFPEVYYMTSNAMTDERLEEEVSAIYTNMDEFEEAFEEAGEE